MSEIISFIIAYIWIGFATLYLMRKLVNSGDCMSLWMPVIFWPLVHAMWLFFFVLLSPMLFIESLENEK